MIQNKHGSEGFTLIGVLLSVLIAATLSISIAQLMTRAETLVDLSRENFIAVNLAREGIELVQAVRDTNWFSGNESDGWLANGLCEENGVEFTDLREFTLDIDRVRNVDGVGSRDFSTLYVQRNGSWTHNNDGEATRYNRVLSVDCSTEDQNYVEVASRVTWESRGKQQEVVLRKQLYNWYPNEQTSN